MEESRTNILDGIKVKWQKLSTGKQRIIVIGGLLAAIGIAVFLGTNDKDKKEPESRLSEEKQAIALDSKMIERTLYGEAQKKLENQSYRDSEQERQIELMQKQIQSMQQLGIPMTTTGVTPSGIKTGFLPSGTPVMVQDQGASIPGGAMQLPQGVRLPPVPGNSKISNIPPPPGLYQSSSRYDGAPSSEMKMESVKPEADIIGGISQISNDQAAAEIEKKKSDELKKDSPRAYLPPSFMAATLISGIDEDADSGSVPY
jgi:conjugal transfer pilus assembly protein TraB